MSLPIHQNRAHQAQSAHPLPGEISPGLLRGRVHEFCGASRVAFALMTLALSAGPVVWITPAWLPERPYSCGLRDHLHPGRLLLVQCRRAEDIQWAAEEALRSAATPAVVAEFPAPPTLTPVRRLHLAAGTAATLGLPLPLGLILTPGEGGAQGAESRWQASPLPAASGLLDSAGIALRIDRLRSRQGGPKAWRLTRPPSAPASSAPLP